MDACLQGKGAEPDRGAAARVGGAEGGKVGVRLEPELEVLQRARLVELVRVRHAEREQRVEVVRIGLDGAAQAGDCLGVVVGVGVRLAERLPRNGILGLRLHRRLEDKHRLAQLAVLEEGCAAGEQVAAPDVRVDRLEAVRRVELAGNVVEAQARRGVPRAVPSALIVAALEPLPDGVEVGRVHRTAVGAARPRLRVVGNRELPPHLGEHGRAWESMGEHGRA